MDQSPQESHQGRKKDLCQYNLRSGQFSGQNARYLLQGRAYGDPAEKNVAVRVDTPFDGQFTNIWMCHLPSWRFTPSSSPRYLKSLPWGEDPFGMNLSCWGDIVPVLGVEASAMGVLSTPVGLGLWE